MTIIDSYIQKLFLKNLSVTLFILVALYAIIEFVEKIDDFLEFSAGALNYLLYPIYQAPLMISNSLPMAVLLATFATVGNLGRTNQLTALLSSGISFTRVSRQFFLIGLLLSGLVFLGQIWLVPWGTREAEYILETQIKGKQHKLLSEGKNLYFRSGNRIVNIARSFPQRGEIFGASIFYFDAEFNPIKRIQAASGEFRDEGIWLLQDVKIWEFSPLAKNVTVFETKEHLELLLEKNPEELVPLWNIPEEMSLGEIYDVIDQMQQEGHDSRTFQVEANVRISRSFIPLIMVLLGVPFALRHGRQRSFSSGVVLSLIIFVIYFIFQAVFVSLGNASILPPFLGAWSANVLMALVGTYMFLQAQET